MSPLLSDERIGREFQTADEVESLPVGTVVIDSDGDGWQKGRSGDWYAAGEYGHVSAQTLAEDFGPLLLVWVPEGSELKSAPEPGPLAGLRYVAAPGGAA